MMEGQPLWLRSAVFAACILAGIAVIALIMWWADRPTKRDRERDARLTAQSKGLTETWQAFQRGDITNEMAVACLTSIGPIGEYPRGNGRTCHHEWWYPGWMGGCAAMRTTSHT